MPNNNHDDQKTSNNNNSNNNNKNIRQQAEQKLSHQTPASADPDLEALTLEEAQRLLHELRVHQVELELQNEELSQMQLRLEASRDSYRELYELAPVAFLTLDDAGHIVEANRTAVKLLGTARTKLLRAPLSLFCAGGTADQLHLHLQQVRETQARQSCELQFKNGAGGEILAHVETTLLQKTSGQAAGPLLTVLVDITTRKKMEQELSKADKLESIGKLAGGIAHDFNNYLATLMANVGLAKLYRENPAKILEKLENMEKATMRAKGLSNQLLTFATGGAPVKEKIWLHEQIVNDINFSLSGSHVLPRFQIAANLHQVEADEGQLNQVLSNIAINGVQAMPAGGVLDVRAENVSLAGDSPATQPPLTAGPYVKISICDEGIGIPEKYLPKIFDPFFTTKDEGRGLGLTTAYSIVKRHGGNLQVESKSGEGTTFTIFLPAAAGEETTPAAAGNTHRGTGTILVMDDQEDLLAVTGESLSALGYEITPARHGEEAVEEYKQAMENGRPFDLVILDLTIPGGMGGKETITELKKMDPGVKAIVASGYSDDPVMKDYASFGFMGSINKPFATEELSKAVAAVMG